MSALIKQGAGNVSRALPLGASASAPVAAEPAPDPGDAEISRLKAEIAWLNEKLAGTGKAENAARAEGRLAGLAEAEDRSDERLAEVRQALVDAAQHFQGQLALLDGLAPQLARAALDKLFARSGDWAAMVEAMIARQLQTLRRSAEVMLYVSGEDFDAAQAAALGGGQCRVEIDPDLHSGAARIVSRLDRIDLDVREQWRDLTALLDTMAGTAA